MCSLKALLVGIFLVCSLVSVRAEANYTCDSKVPETCCNAWKIDIQLDGSKKGELLETSYTKLQSSLASAKKTDQTLCTFWKDRASCNLSYGEPVCTGKTSGFLKDIVDKVAAAPGAAAKKSIIRQITGEVISQAETQWGKIGEAITWFKKQPAPPGQKNPYEGIGSVLKDYAKNLIDGINRVKDLQKQIDLLIHDNIGGYGFGDGDGGLDSILGGIAALQSQVDSMPRLPYVEAKPNPSVDNTTHSPEVVAEPSKNQVHVLPLEGWTPYMKGSWERVTPLYPLGMFDGYEFSARVSSFDGPNRDEPIPQREVVVTASKKVTSEHLEIKFVATMVCDGVHKSKTLVFNSDKQEGFLSCKDGEKTTEVSVQYIGSSSR